MFHEVISVPKFCLFLLTKKKNAVCILLNIKWFSGKAKMLRRLIVDSKLQKS